MLLHGRRFKYLPWFVLAALPASAAAQNYPAKPVRFVAPYPAGGVNDIVARILGGRMFPALGQQWIVDNRPGRGGNIAPISSPDPRPTATRSFTVAWAASRWAPT